MFINSYLIIKEQAYSDRIYNTVLAKLGIDI